MQHRFSLILAALLGAAGPPTLAAESGEPAPAPSFYRPITPAHRPRTETPVGGRIMTAAGAPLPGATVFLKGTLVGTSTNQLGEFRLLVPAGRSPLTLVVSYLGYESQEITLPAGAPVPVIVLQPSPALVGTPAGPVARVAESPRQAPAQLDKVSGRQLGRISTPGILAGLGALPGVDVSSASMLFTAVSTRGFNTARGERVVQLADYMDTALPSLNLSPGNLVGLPELDLESIELIHGPASALYGSNALSGVVLLNSKDPFDHQGLSLRLRGGQRRLLDGQLRYAHRIGDKLAVKLTASAFEAQDWLADNFAANSGSVNPQGSALGYDAINRYGEISTRYSQYRPLRDGTLPNPELDGKTVYMPGFTERELLATDLQTRSYRLQGTAAYRLRSDLTLTVEAKYAAGSSTYQSLNRVRIKGLGTNQYRAELKSAQGFLRLYSTEDFTGSSYELAQLSALLLAAPSREGSPWSYRDQYFSTYNAAYTQARLTLAPGPALAAAKAAADATQLKSTDPRFAALRRGLVLDPVPGRGARQHFNSFLHDLSAQRRFTVSDFGTTLLLGGAYREYRLGSGGLLFADTTGRRLRNYEFGTYAQLGQALLHDRLRLTLATRIDYYRNFAPALSPRAAAVYGLGPDQQHSFRLSYASAYRSPSQLKQYLFKDVNSYILLGNGRAGGFQGYGLPGASGTAPGELTLPQLRLERAGTVEAGYKGPVLPGLLLDLSYFRSRYANFIGGLAFVGNVDGTRPTPAQVEAGRPSEFTDRAASPARIIFAYSNSPHQVRTQGATAGLTYCWRRPLTLTANYSLSTLDRRGLPAGFRTFFNTPRHKFNLGASGEARRFTYSASYHWVQAHAQELPFATGRIGTYGTTDAYLGYLVPGLGATLQAGASNLFDARNVQIIGGPQLGRLAYLGLLLNVK